MQNGKSMRARQAPSSTEERTENRMEQKSVGSAVDIPRGQLTKQNHASARVSDDAVVAARQLDERRDRPIDPSWKGGREAPSTAVTHNGHRGASEDSKKKERTTTTNMRAYGACICTHTHTRAAQLPNKKAYLIPFLKWTVRLPSRADMTSQLGEAWCRRLTLSPLLGRGSKFLAD